NAIGSAAILVEKSCFHFRMVSVLTITQVSQRSGVASSALRFYEERGLIGSQRAGSGHRRYPRSVLRRIAFIVFAQRIGLTLDEIGAELAKLPADRIPTRRDRARLSGQWTKRIDQRIAELERLRAGLTRCLGCGCLSIDKCKLANPADQAGRRGPGPRYWLSGVEQLRPSARFEVPGLTIGKLTPSESLTLFEATARQARSVTPSVAVKALPRDLILTKNNLGGRPPTFVACAALQLRMNAPSSSLSYAASDLQLSGFSFRGSSRLSAASSSSSLSASRFDPRA